MKLLFYGCSERWMGCRSMSLPINGTQPLLGVLESTPALAPILAHRDALLISVNCAVRDQDATVQDSDEVAFLPPFADG